MICQGPACLQSWCWLAGQRGNGLALGMCGGEDTGVEESVPEIKNRPQDGPGDPVINTTLPMQGPGLTLVGELDPTCCSQARAPRT